MEQEHRLSPGLLLNEDSNLSEAGYAFNLVKQYDRKAIKGLKSRIKEWDYYYIGNKQMGLALTVADNSYMWMVSVSFLNFATITHPEKRNFTKTKIGFFSFGKLNMPSSSESGDVIFKRKGFSFEFIHENNTHHLKVTYEKFSEDKKPLIADIILTPTNRDSMVIATPFKKKGHFYYNQKINLLKADGTVKINDITYLFNNDECFGVLDWGRGVWPYQNTWYWSSMNGIFNGERIGFNLGYGFGDTSSSSENMFFYRDQAYKLKDVRFNIPEKNNKFDYMSTWTLTSLSGDINVRFKPVFDRFSDMNVLFLRSRQHQVFGLFTGNIRINGEEIHFEEIPGFAEKVYNRW